MRVSLPYGPPLLLPTDITDPHLWVGVVGIALAVLGSRLYRLAIIGPGVALGAAAGLEVASATGFEHQLVAACCLGVLGGLGFYLLERVAIALSGAFVVGGLANVGAALYLGQTPEWYVPAAGAVVGVFLFPSLYKRLLPVVTAILGGLCVSWAVHQPEDLRVVGAVALLGLVGQLLTRTKGKSSQK